MSPWLKCEERKEGKNRCEEMKEGKNDGRKRLCSVGISHAPSSCFGGYATQNHA
jgi:hypothetical protein